MPVNALNRVYAIASICKVNFKAFHLGTATILCQSFPCKPLGTVKLAAMLFQPLGTVKLAAMLFQSLGTVKLAAMLFQPLGTVKLAAMLFQSLGTVKLAAMLFQSLGTVKLAAMLFQSLMASKYYPRILLKRVILSVGVGLHSVVSAGNGIESWTKTTSVDLYIGPRL